MLSLPHLVVIFIVALVIFGPQKLPELARMLGKASAEFRKMTGDFRYAMEEEMREIERQTRIREMEATAASVQAQPGRSLLEGSLARSQPGVDAASPAVSELPPPADSDSAPAGSADTLPHDQPGADAASPAVAEQTPPADSDSAPSSPAVVVTPQEKPSDDNATV
jgi:TatA/E family protein of Tat protein translocase